MENKINIQMYLILLFIILFTIFFVKDFIFLDQDTVNKIVRNNYTQSTLVKRDCINNPYLGKENVHTTDCGLLCNTKNFQYLYIESNNYLVWGKDFIQNGAYCVPPEIINCNLKTSVLNKSISSWECIPKWPTVFDNNVIKVCKGYLYDNKHKKVYDYTIPHNLDLSEEGPYETLDDGLTRFQCADEIFTEEKYKYYDENRNEKIRPEFSSFLRIKNMCASLLTDTPANKAFPDYLYGKCDCAESINNKLDDIDILGTVCSPCLNNKMYTEINGTEYPVTAKSCIKSYDDYLYKDSRISVTNKLPCGNKTFTSKSAACLEAKVLIGTNLSPYAQQVLNKEL